MEMELGLYLGDAPVRTPKQPFFLADDSHKNVGVELGLGFCMADGLLERRDEEDEEEDEEELEDERRGTSSAHPITSLQHLIPFSHATKKSSLKSPWHAGNSGINMDGCSRGGLDVNMIPSMDETDQDGGSAAAGTSSSPNSGGVSSFQMDLSIYRTGAGTVEGIERASSRASDEEENNGSTRKKLRLSKEQSAYLEESFKEHNTPNPKQKLALADKLNLRPRQVEVWFQNRRARTKLKQTEVDCEYLKKCCEKLTEENRRLQKELQELRALKSAHPYYMHVPATTLTMCPSCEKIASATTTPTPTNNKPDNGLEINHDGQKTDSPWSSFLNPFWHQQKTPTVTTTTTTRHHNSAAL